MIDDAAAAPVGGAITPWMYCVPELPPNDTTNLRFQLAEVVEDRELIDRAVDHARVDADDVRHGLAVGGRRGREVGRARARRIGERLEGVVRRSIEVPDLSRRGAVGVERRSEAGGFRAAFERLEVRTRQDRPGDRVVGDGEAGFGSRLLGRRHQPVRAEPQALDQSAELTAGGIEREARRDVLAVQRHAQLIHRRAGRRLDRDERIAAADQIRARRQRANLERRPRFDALPAGRDQRQRRYQRSLVRPSSAAPGYSRK